MLCDANGVCGTAKTIVKVERQQQQSQLQSDYQGAVGQQIDSCGGTAKCTARVVRQFANPSTAIRQMLAYQQAQDQLLAQSENQQLQQMIARQQSSGGWWSDVTGFISRHRVVIGIGLGILAIATGGAGLVLGAAALTGSATVSAGLLTGLAGAAVTTGAGAAYADEPDCAHGSQTACFGRDMGFTGAAMGLPGLGAGGLTMAGVIADDSAWNVAATTIGAGGFQFGTFGTVSDITSAVTHDGNG